MLVIMSGLASASLLSPEDIETLQGRLSKLEAGVDAFSVTLNRLSNARRLSGRGSGCSHHQHATGRRAFASPASALAMAALVLVGTAMILALRKMREQKV